MFPVVTGGGSRLIIKQTVRARVYQTFRQNNNIIAIRMYTFTAVRMIIWRNYLIQVRMYSTTRITSWFPAWLAQWRLQQPIQQQPIQQPRGGGEQRDPRRLTVEQLVAMMGDAPNYLVHGTPLADVGTLQAPLVGIEDPEGRVTNRQAQVGVFAFKGIIGAFDAGYGPYYVVMHANMGIWIQQHGHWFRPGTGAIRDEEIVGYCLREDMAAAKERRRGGK
jgi:hypothetical protein